MCEIKICVDCRSEFEYSEGKHLFFLRNGLEDPKRCPTCRAIRKGFTDKELKCQRCGKTFIYPQELQLYARTYKWDPPTYCLGGCGKIKYAKDYQLSPFEILAKEIFGGLARLIKGKSTTELPGTRTSFLPKVSGFEKTHILTNREVELFVNKIIPKEHTKNVHRIIFSDKVIPIGKDLVSRGFYDFEKKIIIINKEPFGVHTKDRIKEVICHEFGHAVYYPLHDSLKAEWYSLSEKSGPLTRRAKNVWNKEEIRDMENFAEGYQLYIMNPWYLIRYFHDVYYFFCNDVFKGREYL